MEQRALAPVYNPDAAEQMGLPPDTDLGPNEHNIYQPKPGTVLQESEVAPAYRKPGGGRQYFTGDDPDANTGPRVKDLDGEPIKRADGSTIEPTYDADGKEIRVHGVNRTGGPLSCRYGTEWKVDDIDPAERDAIEALERGE
jgi:hypothetical protein